jgi:hypothetical protein
MGIFASSVLLMSLPLLSAHLRLADSSVAIQRALLRFIDSPMATS